MAAGRAGLGESGAEKPGLDTLTRHTAAEPLGKVVDEVVAHAVLDRAEHDHRPREFHFNATIRTRGTLAIGAGGSPSC